MPSDLEPVFPHLVFEALSRRVETLAGGASDGHPTDEWPELDELLEEARRRSLADTLARRCLAELLRLDEEQSTLAVSRLEHCLQTATRAERAGRERPYVFCALLHDLGDYLAPYNHECHAAAIIAPFVSPDLHWMVAHHGLMQECHDRSAARSRCPSEWRPAFDLTAEFCDEFDSPSHDPHYESYDLEHFGPLLVELFAEPLSVWAGEPIFFPERVTRTRTSAPKRRRY
jgi:predicted HD phosphohydrolase